MEFPFHPEHGSSSSEDSGPPSSHFKFLCCDIVKRLREDIDCLSQDHKRLGRNRANLVTLRQQFNVVCSDVKQKLETLTYLKNQSLTPNLTEMKAMETRYFLEYTWSLVRSSVSRESKKNRFMSIRGIRVIDYIKQLIAICDNSQMKYGYGFHHAGCFAFYSNFTRQLQSPLVQEMFEGDLIEIYSYYIGSAIPVLINLISIINLYVNNQSVVDYNGLCNEIFNRGPCENFAMRALASLLRGDLLGLEPVNNVEPVFDDRGTNFYQLAEELAHHILRISLHSHPQPLEGPYNILGPGILDPWFLNCLPAPRTSPPETLTSEQSTPTPLVTQPIFARQSTPQCQNVQEKEQSNNATD